jgi:hypothetical protein
MSLCPHNDGGPAALLPEQYTVAPNSEIARIKAELFRGQLDDTMMIAGLEISRATLERYIGQGLPFYKIGRRRLFDIEAVRHWIASHQQRNAPARGRGRPRKV